MPIDDETLQKVLPAVIEAAQARPPPSLRNAQAVNTEVHHIRELEAAAAADIDLEFHTALHINCPEPDRSLPPRPPQGGQRITEEWLRSIAKRHSLWAFRFSGEDLIELAEVLNIPEIIITPAGNVFPRVEALALLCARFRSAGDIYDLVQKHDQSQGAISEIVNWLVRFLDERWKHLLSFDPAHMFSRENLASYAQAIAEKGSPLLRLFGFIDCTIRKIARPTWLQQQAYSGYKKSHALKYQGIMLPNGIIGDLYGPVEGRHTDLWLLDNSGLLEKCAEHALLPDVDDDTPFEERYFQVFGDSAYGVGPNMMSNYSGAGQRTEEELEFNRRMAKMRIEVEHGFGIVSSKWAFLNASWKMHLWSSPVGRYYRVAVLLTNAHNCLQPNQVAQFFDLQPPELQEYFRD